jgi:RecJ-like exonuclease
MARLTVKNRSCKYCKGTGSKKTRTGRTAACATCGGTGERRTTARRNPKAKKNPFAFDRPRQKKREAFGVRFRALDSVDAHRKLRREYDAASFDVLHMKRIAPDKYEFKLARVR